MAEKLDPYHRWLGIPPAEQPANHYRLLGLVSFEADPEVIRDAAERQMAHVRGYALGKNAELSQKILNELAGAKACLADAAKKEAYDRKLRESMPASMPAAVAAEPPAVPPVAVAALPVGAPEAVRQAAAAVPAPVRIEAPPVPPAAASKTPLLIAGGVAVAALLLVLVGVSLVVAVSALNWSRQDRQDKIAEDGGEKQPPKPPPGRPPQLAAIQQQTVIKGDKPLQFSIVKDPGTSKSLVFDIPAGELAGAAIDRSGEFTFTPGEQQAPGTYEITVRAVAQDLDKQGVQTTFRVTVKEREVIRPPIIPPPKLVRVQPLPVNPDEDCPAIRVRVMQPGDTLRFSLVDEPDGARIHPVSGEFTWHPTSEHAGTPHRIKVRVTDERRPSDLYDEMTFTVFVNAPAKPPVVVDPVFRIQLPSGKTLSSDIFKQIRQSVRTDTEAAFSQCFKGSINVVPLWQDESQSALKAVANTSQERLDGASIGFYTGKDPFTCRMRALQEQMTPFGTPTYPGAMPTYPGATPGGFTPSPSPGAPGMGTPSNPGPAPGTAPTPGSTSPGAYPRSNPAGPITYPRSSRTTAKPKRSPEDLWAEVMPSLYVTYHRDKWDKWLATWNNKGEKDYWCEHLQDKRHGLCCLFKDDRLAIVAEYEMDRLTAAYLISGNEIVKTFTDPANAQSDATAAALLQEIDRTEQELKKNADAFEKEVKWWLRKRRGMLDAMKSKATDARTRAIYEQQNKQFKAIAERTRGG